MLQDVKELLYTTAYREVDMDRLLDPHRPSFLRFDPELGYVFVTFTMRDGIDDSVSVYNYEPHGGHRRVVHYADQPCRINVYGDSYTQGQQVSDAETWEEVLSAHLREPIRNFGVGGYSVYIAYRRCLRTEATDLAAENVILNIWDDDHVRNLDQSRWIRTAWDSRDHPWSGADAPWPIHGFPWAHLRFNVETGRWDERLGFCRTEQDLRELADRDTFYEKFKDDQIVHLFALTQGGEVPIDELEAVAEALDIRVDLRGADVKKRMAEAEKLRQAYGLKSTIYLLDQMKEWGGANGKKLMFLLSYDTKTVIDYIQKGKRFDQELVDYLEAGDVPYVDCLKKQAEDYKQYKLPLNEYLAKFYIPAAGAAVFGHYGPYGNHWFAYAVKDEIVRWLDPKPPAYRPEEAMM